MVGERPIEILFDLHRFKVEKIPKEEIERAKQFLKHLISSEADRQKIKNGHIRKSSSKSVPLYSNLRQIIEDDLNIPLTHFLEDFETRLRQK